MSPDPQHQRTPSRRSLLSLLKPPSYVPTLDSSAKHGAGAMGERAGHQPQNTMSSDAENKKNSNTHMNTTIAPGTQHTNDHPPVPLPHTTSTESTNSTSATPTAIFRPNLPPRPETSSPSKSTTLSTPPLHRPSLTDRKPTTQVSSLDVQTLTFPDGTRGTFDSDVNTSSPSKGTSLLDYISRKSSRVTHTEDIEEDKASITSLTPSSIHTKRIPSGITSPRSIFSGFGASGCVDLTPAQRLLALQTSPPLPPFLSLIPDYIRAFGSELDNLPEIQHNLASDESNEEFVLAQFRQKQKQYFILSSSGKPIWSRHGDLNLINGYIGVISTIISSFAGMKHPLQSFTAGTTLFVITNPGKGPLYFVGVSRVDGEGVGVVEKQLDSLYQQILSTLTLPRLKQLFTHRPGTDLSRSLEGTEKLLSSLCDNFTAGAPSSLLSALECLRMRKTHRQVISNTLFQHKNEKLLYGLIVAGGKLVSVLRPKRHSLHPGDLELIFNMLFSGGGGRKKVGGEGENWVPVCLPGFNDGGYLYLYVSFLPLAEVGHRRGGSNASTPRRTKDNSSFESRLSAGSVDSPLRSSFVDDNTATPKLTPPKIAVNDEVQDEEVAILLISPDREAFFEMKSMRDALVASLAKNGSLDHISHAVKLGRPSIPQLLLPQITARDRRMGGDKVQMRHFMYKSRADVQFVQSRMEWGEEGEGEIDEYERHCRELIKHRRLLSIYAGLHTSLHSRHTHPRIIFSTNVEYIALAWITPAFELYAVAGRTEHTDVSTDEEGTSKEKRELVDKEMEKQKAQLAKEAERVVKWVEKERERVFILGGAVF